MRITDLLALALLFVAFAVQAHGDGHKGARKTQPMVETDFGRTGDAKKATRTIRVDMSDRMRFTPDAGSRRLPSDHPGAALVDGLERHVALLEIGGHRIDDGVGPRDSGGD